MCLFWGCNFTCLELRRVPAVSKNEKLRVYIRAFAQFMIVLDREKYMYDTERYVKNLKSSTTIVIIGVRAGGITGGGQLPSLPQIFTNWKIRANFEGNE